MMVTRENPNQLVISVEELANHYSFQLKQVGVADSNALDLASLMVQSTKQLTESEQARRDDAINLLEQQKVAAPISMRKRRYRKRRARPSRPVVETTYQTPELNGLYGMRHLYKAM
ncbi:MULTISPECIES: hypothetical protein [unclassified Leptolyngbya]|uniref:hypothetical protein n=1 Tax=unclassified Leptolyngbya TaxID=2650499 RepID=UPI0016844172|nr:MULTISPECIES: hypothetical protein [unclassified Leptolyngbya]MBD1913093.1 hypothetical protein [Leptolyngbya sp. FACHB-8]MBD2155561.1 hypothetical protein [Leptolyngbya sp. FACHB-16]